MNHKAMSSSRSVSSFARLVVLLGALVAVQQPALVGQAVPAKLATVLGDLARAVPQDGRGSIFDRARLAANALPRSVQDAARARRLRFGPANTVQVYILMSEVTPAHLDQLAAAGVKVEIASARDRRVQARVPVRNLQRIAALPFVTFIRPPSYAIRHAGAVQSEGDGIHRSDTARSSFGVDGTGVRVGVISDGIKGIFGTKCDSCDGVSGGPIASGDVPGGTGSRDDGVLKGVTGDLTARSFRSDEDLEDTHSFFQPCGFRGAGAEGGALLEIVHDLAPGAQLSFANADTSLSFNDAVNALAADNDVVVDDLGFLGEPANGQSSVSRNTAAALNNPANRIRTYVTSVGNAANDHYFGAYAASNSDGQTVNGITSPGRLHLFRRTDETTDVLGLGDQPHDLISLPHNGEVVVVLTWDDPAGQSGNNYDLYLVDDDTGAVVARSTDAQRGSQDAIEAVDFLNRGDTGFFRIVVQNVNDQAAVRNLNMFSFQPQCAVDGPRRLASGRHERHNYNTPSRSVLAQSDAGGSPVSVISVGAICSASAAATGVFAGSDAPSESCNDINHATIQFFSSIGPTLDGRLKPDVSGIDGVSITGAGRFPSPFFGTSAAAPHVAAVAALVLQAAPCLRSGGPAELDVVSARVNLRNSLVLTADSLGGSVPNMTFGYGLVNAVRAIEAARSLCTPGPDPPPNPNPPQPQPPSPGDGTILVNSTQQFQTIHGWEAAVLATVSDYSTISDAQWGAIFDMSTTELNVTRARLEIRSGTEGSGTNYNIVNDNGDPNVINPNGFNWTTLDFEIDRLVGPWRKRVSAAGMQPYVVLTYVDFGSSSFEHYQNPQEYAEFMLAVFQHMQGKYGFVPQGIEAMLEPNDVSGWSPVALANAIVAAGQRLQANGFSVPEFIAPSTSNLDHFRPYVDEMMANPAAAALIKEFSYHRYGGANEANYEAIVARAVQYGKRTSMLEYWTPELSHRHLSEDLTLGRASAWQKGVFADNFGCTFSHYIRLVNGAPELCPTSRLLRQYMRYIRPGARRIGATSSNPVFVPVAFINTDGRYVVVVKAEGGGGPFTVAGLPAGTYAVSWTENGGQQATTQLADVTIGAGQVLATALPVEGALTIVAR